MKVSGWRLDVSQSSRVTHVHLSAPTGADYLGLGISVRITRENWRGRPLSAPPRKELVRGFSHLPWAEFDADVDVLLHPGEALRLETTAPGVCCEWTVDATQLSTPAATEPSSTNTFLQALATTASMSPAVEMARRGRFRLGVDPAARLNREEQQLARLREAALTQARTRNLRGEREEIAAQQRLIIDGIPGPRTREALAEKQPTQPPDPPQPRPTRKVRLK